MRIVLLALGTQGDVQPYIALGRGLQAAGYSARLVTHQNYESLVKAHGLDFWPVQGDVHALMQTDEMRELVAKGNFLAITARTAQEARKAAQQWAAEGLAACRDADLLVGGMGGLFIGAALAEKLDLPLIQAYVVPFTPTAAFPGAIFPAAVARLGGVANRVSHHLLRQMMWQGSRGADRQMRRQVLDLPAAPFWGPYRADIFGRYPILYGFSPSVVPRPPDWSDAIHVTGYWMLDPAPDWTPPPALVEFLQAGPPPIYIGFGSMGDRDPAATARMVLEALAQGGERAILLAGWGNLRPKDVPETVYLVDSIPHAWLFPRVAAVVHHGGAGTTAAGLSAGVPSVIVPFFGDQPFWGRRVAELGVGPAPIPRKRLTADRLAQAIHSAVRDPAMRQRAAALGAAIRAEDGIANAVAIIHESRNADRLVAG